MVIIAENVKTGERIIVLEIAQQICFTTADGRLGWASPQEIRIVSVNGKDPKSLIWEDGQAKPAE
mgnify:FL=1|tara:strand:- start:15098 stop:15292 length:195 start_codon:yes stop_codon:yes gene_type:complete